MVTMRPSMIPEHLQDVAALERWLVHGRLFVASFRIGLALDTSTVVARAPRANRSTSTSIQSEIRRFRPAAVIDSVSTLDAILPRAVAPWRFTSWRLDRAGLIRPSSTLSGCDSRCAPEFVGESLLSAGLGYTTAETAVIRPYRSRLTYI
jgi:hypothetical protein